MMDVHSSVHDSEQPLGMRSDLTVLVQGNPLNEDVLVAQQRED